MIYAGYNPRFSSDEQYTPAYAVAPIIKYIPKDKTVWCPFDTETCSESCRYKYCPFPYLHRTRLF